MASSAATGDARKSGYTISQFELYVYFLWVFGISTVFYILLAARYTSFSGWLWFALSQSLVTALVVAFTVVAPGTTKTLLTSSWVAVYTKSILLASEAMSSVALGILVERYHHSNDLFDYYFLVLIVLKVSLYAALGLTRKGDATSETTSTAKQLSSLPISHDRGSHGFLPL